MLKYPLDIHDKRYYRHELYIRSVTNYYSVRAGVRHANDLRDGTETRGLNYYIVDEILSIEDKALRDMVMFGRIMLQLQIPREDSRLFGKNLLDIFEPHFIDKNYFLAAKSRYDKNKKLMPGRKAPNVLLDEDKTLSYYHGSPVLLHFWGTWCGSCLEEIPQLNILSKKYAQDLRIVNFAMEYSPPEKWKEYIDRYDLQGDNYYIANEDHDIMRSAFQVQYLPLYVVLDYQGTIVSISNTVGDGMISDAIERLLNP